MIIMKKWCVNFTCNVLYALQDVRCLATSKTPISINNKLEKEGRLFWGSNIEIKLTVMGFVIKKKITLKQIKSYLSHKRPHNWRNIFTLQPESGSSRLRVPKGSTIGKITFALHAMRFSSSITRLKPSTLEQSSTFSPSSNDEPDALWYNTKCCDVCVRFFSEENFF